MTEDRMRKRVSSFVVVYTVCDIISAAEGKHWASYENN